jgi:hypothetical chaperone protein
VGKIDYYGAEMHYVRDVFAYVDELKPGRLLQLIKTTLRSPGYEGTQIFERYYSLGDIIAAYLQALKQRAEAMLGVNIDEATLGRPVMFSQDPEQDHKAEETLREAAYLAGFRQVDFELEPVAAALDYEKTLESPQNTLVFDFGGGTLDITIMRLGDARSRRVYANGGIGVAGSDFDRAIIQQRLLPHFGKGMVDQDPDILELVNTVADWIALPELSTPQARVKLEAAILQGKAPVRMKSLESLIFNDLAFSFYNRVEAAKISLSCQGAALITLKDRDIDIWELYTQNQFERDIRGYYERIEAVLLETIAASGLEVGQIDAVVKTGGSSNIPVFSQMLARLFGAEKIKASDAFSSVAAGLAIRAYEGPGE